MEDLDLDSTKVTAHTRRKFEQAKQVWTYQQIYGKFRQISKLGIPSDLNSPWLRAILAEQRWRNGRQWREGWMPSGRLLRWIGCGQSLIGDFLSPFLEEEMGMRVKKTFMFKTLLPVLFWQANKTYRIFKPIHLVGISEFPTNGKLAIAK
jgi:hypothetical protein